MSRQSGQADVELLEAVRGGSTAAYGVLYQRHAAAARALARQLVPGDKEVEDVLVETFAQVLEQIRRGGGPIFAFRPYLLMALRRYVATGEVDLTGPDDLYVDPDLAGLERSPLARAYLALPERWRMVLWHAEIEGAAPAELAPLLGLSPGGVAELAERARDGLRQAYLRVHEETGPAEECRSMLPTIIDYAACGPVRRGTAGAGDEHVAECIDCRAVFLELADLTHGLRVAVGQLIAGPAMDDYLAELAAAAGEETAGARAHGVPVLRRLPTPLRAVMAGATTAALALGAFYVLNEPIVREGLLPLGAVRTPAPATPHRTHHPWQVPSASSTGSAVTPAHPRIERGSRAQPPREQAGESARRSAPPTRTSASAPARVRPALVATIDSVGALVRDRPGMIALSLRNIGGAATREVRASLKLPPGVTPLAATGRKVTGRKDVAVVSKGWACRTAGRVVRCTRRGLAAGEASAALLRVKVAPDAPTGERAFGARVRSGTQEVIAESAARLCDPAHDRERARPAGSAPPRAPSAAPRSEAAR